MSEPRQAPDRDWVTPETIKAKVAQAMFDHFPVRQVTPFGLVGMFCNCGVRVEGTWADHVKVVVDELFSISEQTPKLNTRSKK